MRGQRDNTTMAGHRHSLAPMPGDNLIQCVHHFGAKAFEVDTATSPSSSAAKPVVVFLHLLNWNVVARFTIKFRNAVASGASGCLQQWRRRLQRTPHGTGVRKSTEVSCNQSTAALVHQTNLRQGGSARVPSSVSTRSGRPCRIRISSNVIPALFLL